MNDQRRGVTASDTDPEFGARRISCWPMPVDEDGGVFDAVTRVYSRM